MNRTVKRCPVEDCEHLLRGLGSHLLARDAASLAVFFPVFQRAAEVWPHEFPEHVYSFVIRGERLFRLLHNQAHRPVFRHVPGREIRAWVKVATESCKGLARVDPEWFVRYWTQVEARGIRPATAIRQVMQPVTSGDRDPSLVGVA